MKKLLGSLALFLALGGSAFAQNPTAVTGTITDPNSVAYYPAQVTACLSPVTIRPTVGGQLVNPNIGTNYCIGPISTATNGSFSMGLHANANITPGATTWIFTVTTLGSAPPAGTGSQTFQSAGITISGASQDIGATLSALAPKLLNSGGGGSSFPLTTAAAINSGGSITVNTGGSITPAGSGTITATSMPASGLTGTPCTAAQGCTGVASPTIHTIPIPQGASAYNFVACNVTGQSLVGTNGADPSCKSAGLSGTDVNSASYSVQCDSATATVDRATTLRFITTTPTVTVPDPTASGCGSNFSFVMVASGVTATVNRTTTAVFNIYGRSGDPTLAATTFNLTTGQYATVSSPDNTNWLVRIVPAAAAGAGVGTLYSVGAAQSTIATASPQFFPINGANSGGAGEGNVASVIGGTGCTAKNAYVVTSNTNGAAALTITLRNAATLAGMANTALVITVGSGAAAGTFNDTTHTVAISAGTVLSWNATMGGAGLTSAQIVGIGFQCN